MILSLLLFGVISAQDPGPPTNLPDVVSEAPPAPEEGRVTLSCRVQPSGAMTDCRVVSETPEGAGFAEAALAGARRARLAPRGARSAGSGDRVNFTVRFQRP